MFYGLTMTTLRKIVFEYAEVNKIANRFDKTTKMAGKDWVYGFIKRQPNLAVRQTTPTSIARAIGFNAVQVQRFYTNLKECLNKYNFQPGKIFNMDETGISTVPKKTPKVISLKGKKNVNKIVSGERGQTITVVCCVSATGNYVPPAFIFPRKRMKGELLDGAPAGSVGMTSDSGFINTDLYLNWLGHFKDYVSPSVNNPVLLIVDNHSSHISLQASLFCRQHGIVVLTLPPHSSHKMQPLDRAFYSPLKGQYAVECDRWMASHPGRAITQYQIATIFEKAFKKIANVGNATSGFQVTGICPFNDELFTEADFAPASVTDMFVTSTEQPEPTSVNLPQTTRSSQEDLTGLSDTSLTQQKQENQIVTTAEIHVSANKPKLNASKEQKIPISQQYEDINAIQVEKERHNESEQIEKENNEQQRNALRSDSKNVEKFPISTADNNLLNANSHTPLTIISPLPKAKHAQKRRKNSSKSEIITASPFKNELEEKQKERDRKVSKVGIPKMKKIEDTINEKAKKLGKKNKSKKTPVNLKEDIYCPLCAEKYVDPPTEEWIECGLCGAWWHEECTDNADGLFTCDQCGRK